MGCLGIEEGRGDAGGRRQRTAAAAGGADLRRRGGAPGELARARATPKQGEGVAGVGEERRRHVTVAGRGERGDGGGASGTYGDTVGRARG